jgi:glutathione synthase/RimK-type ligase-like ATP-grasp enzyme
VRVALAGCREIDDPDEPALIDALGRLGVVAEGQPWDADVDWTSYDLVAVRSTWDYVGRRGEFLAWADSVPRLANPAGVLRWNTDKRYLAELAAAGLPVVPTTYVGAGDVFTPPEGDYVVKPTVSAAAMDTARYGPADEADAREHVDRLLAAGREVMVQPYLASVETERETSLLFVGGEYSHGAHKGRVLTGVGALSPTEWDLGPREPSAAERALADQVLAAIDEPLLYARVDLLAGEDGPLLLELELTEPFLFLDYSDGAADRFARAIRSAAQRPSQL